MSTPSAPNPALVDLPPTSVQPTHHHARFIWFLSFIVSSLLCSPIGDDCGCIVASVEMDDMEDLELMRVCSVGGNPVSAFLSWRLQATNACDVTLVWKSGFEHVAQYGISFK